jgi:hypothetical protein
MVLCFSQISNHQSAIANCLFFCILYAGLVDPESDNLLYFIQEPGENKFRNFAETQK